MDRVPLIDLPDAAAAAALSFVGSGRRSVRRYKPDAVSPDMIECLLRAAIAAPSAHNRQPWRFAVIDSFDRKATLATSMGDRLRSDRLRDGDSESDVERDVGRSYARITSAPVIIVVCLTMEHMDIYPDPVRSRCEHLMAVQSTAMAGANLLLAAHAVGLGACWLCAPLFCPDVIGQVLGLPAHWQAQGLITLGYPSAPAKPFLRNPIHEVAVFVRSDEDESRSS
ncbi:nitroreductase (plasmid) [Paraburkholderia sp. PGU19]|uniref:nitroreductase family protein n=1 Tax=Paraburkholderia sp. PGU19 TaxID=2735434 RepID=UPI0015DA3293|nr:nitroreductase family protein [Paraburkholderia sp. PGU19]BCG04913.1 nitroreductase [Paraburkholderia sp. PGU19]